MADSYVQLPTDSTGKKVRSVQSLVGAQTVEEQVVRLEKSIQAELPAYSLCVLGSAFLATKDHLQIQNGPATGYNIEIIRIKLSADSGAAVAGWPALLKLCRCTGDGTGTNATADVAKLNSGNAAIPTGMVLLHTPTAAPSVIDAPLAVASVSPEDTGGNAEADLWTEEPGKQTLVVKPNECLTVNQVSVLAAGTLNITLIFRLKAV